MNAPAAIDPVPEADEAFEAGGWPARGPRMSTRQFDFFRALAKEKAGINLPDFKRNMVYRRMYKRLTALQLEAFEDYVTLLSGPGGHGEFVPFVNALTTNKTSFLREPHHFEHMAKVSLPAIRESAARTGNKHLRIWSAGCSSGQEPYSIAMTLADAFPDLAQWDAKILATDIDTDMIRHASAGIYAEQDLEDVPPAQKKRYFEQIENGLHGVRQNIRQQIVFNQLNLHESWPMQRKLEIVFCRNVIIYFDKPTQCVLFDRFANAMAEGGWLYIGHSESLYKVTERFAPVGQSVYRKIA